MKWAERFGIQQKFLLLSFGFVQPGSGQALIALLIAAIVIHYHHQEE